ncbi:GbsR/MarR family transcriptional regulator [Streptomyces sp. NPDC058374]|uniref:GbsR/MarR family transcriptional regulator n=1 Tax=unclassified Streptomyces TaxID=2593676 RepID=UPI0036587A1B
MPQANRETGTGTGSQAAAGSAGAGSTDAPGEEQLSLFVERFAADMVEAGMPRMAARVFGALLSSPEGVLTSSQLSEQLRISPAAVSGAIGYLVGITLVRREREPGSRRDRYRLHPDQWYEALTSRDARLVRWSSTLRDGIAMLGPDTPPARRMAETLEFFDFMRREMESLLSRWRAHREEVFGPAGPGAAD